MKKNLLTAIALLFLSFNSLLSQQIVETKYFSNHKELGGDVVLLKSTQKVEDQKSIVSFEIEAPRSGGYYISFWLCPAKLNNGTFASYDVSVNGKNINGKIIPTRGDWHSISLSNGQVIELDEGVNVISVIGTIPDIPSVEHIRMSSIRDNSIIDGSKYESYKANIIQESRADAENNAFAFQTLIADTLSNDDNNFTQNSSPRNEAPLYDYTYRIGAHVKYTFYKTVYFTQGQQVALSTTRIDNVSHVMEFFSATSPENYSWTSGAFNSGVSLNITIPQSGYYYVRVRTHYIAESGVCNVNINNQTYYDNVPICNMSVTCTQDTSKVYNTFTCNSTCDPRLWIAEIPSGYFGVISAFNDDYDGNGDFDWGVNSRIKKKYPRPVHAALLSSFASYNPTGICDLYIKCKNSNINCFPNLEEDDAILSSPETEDYNCISWTGGITSYWEWPPYEGSLYYSPDSLIAFDNFYASKGLTRTGATADNSVVDLWAMFDISGNQLDYSHASIRKGANTNAHGYDWESKCGPLDRIFHPRYSLVGRDYGHVVEHYIRYYGNSSTLEEEIANGTSRIEYVDFDADERDFLTTKINTIRRDVLSEFQQLYERWKNVTRTTIHSNPKIIADCEEYRELLDYCKANDELLYAIYERLGKGDCVAAIILIGDLTFKEHISIMHKVREKAIKNMDKDGIKTIRSPYSNCMAYVKELLAIENSGVKRERRSGNTETGITYSNSADFCVLSSSNGVNVEFELTKQTNVSLNLIDLSGNVVCSAVNAKMLEGGKHSYFMRADPKRPYLVHLMLDGRVNVKKIMVM